MQPIESPAGGETGAGQYAAEVGDFPQGTAVSRWALGRYLVGRAIGDVIARWLLLISLFLLLVAGLIYWQGPVWVGVGVTLVALSVLVLRWMLSVMLGRFTRSDRLGPIEPRLQGLVSGTRSDLRQELKRVGVPSSFWTAPLLIWRLISRRKRAETLTRLRSFDVERAVARHRVDELYLLISNELIDRQARR